MQVKTKKQSNAWGQIVTKAWDDKTFKKRLLSHPAEVLKEYGLEVATGIQVKVTEDTDKVFHLTLPLKDNADELSEEELGNVAGGFHIMIGGRYVIMSKKRSKKKS